MSSSMSPSKSPTYQSKRREHIRFCWRLLGMEGMFHLLMEWDFSVQIYKMSLDVYHRVVFEKYLAMIYLLDNILRETETSSNSPSASYVASEILVKNDMDIFGTNLTPSEFICAFMYNEAVRLSVVASKINSLPNVQKLEAAKQSLLLHEVFNNTRVDGDLKEYFDDLSIYFACHIKPLNDEELNEAVTKHVTRLQIQEETTKLWLNLFDQESSSCLSMKSRILLVKSFHHSVKKSPISCSSESEEESEDEFEEEFDPWI